MKKDPDTFSPFNGADLASEEWLAQEDANSVG
jgi:hypothetical protein